MGKKARYFAEQLLIVSTVFIVFLLLFENKWVVPVWLQPIGRMHPVVLHFPIVLLLLAFGMEFFRFKPTYASNEFYRAFLHHLLLIGLLSAALTVIMGLFLAKGDGYEGDVLKWHKYLGVGVLFVGEGFYWVRHATWYTQKVAQVSTMILTVLLLVGGHLGATLTHGTGFITEPLTRNDQVNFDDALVFDHVIQPIFEQKCVSCHNPDKLKGELMLTDEKSILKGGKTGKLFVAGKPEISLLLQRIHLPLEEKKHMPPVGKAQLTDTEKTLLALWIKSNANFKQKVSDLPTKDSLRVLAAGLFAPAENKGEVYDFAAADEETIEKLSNDYRTIAPLAKESPALSVNLYNKNAYSPEKLTELDELKKQIVFLNLNKMPVKDADLKNISQFENLQKLDLNFTDITGKGLAELTSLKHLKTLNISGTKVGFKEIEAQIRNFKNLKTLTVWNTGLSVSEIQQLQKNNRGIQVIGGFRDDGSHPIKLNPPQIKNGSTIFNQPILVQLSHPIKGVQIRYTTDGTAPDSMKSAVFNNQTLLKESATIRAKAYKTGWFGSDEVAFNFFKNTYKPDSVNLLLPLNRVHQAAGANTFFDGKLGTFNANSPAWANNWAGVRNNDLALMSEFKQPVVISSVGLRIMEETETGIFPPEVIEVWGGSTRTQLKLIATLKPTLPNKVRTHLLQAITCKFKPQAVSYLKIVAKPLQKIPDWHGSKGRTALLLVDEMFLN